MSSTMTSVQETQLVPTENGAGVNEEKILCIFRDMTDHNRCQAVNLNLPASTSATSICLDVASQYSYVPDSFSLLYENDNKAEVIVNDLGDKPLSEIIDRTSGKKKHYFTINEKDGYPPKKTEPPETIGLAALNLEETKGTVCGPTNYQASGDSTAAGGSYNSSSDLFSYSSAVLKSDTGFVGMVNQAMTCYLNSLVQTLFMTPEFRNAIYRWELDETTGINSSKTMSIPYHLQKLFLQLQTSKKRAVETTDLTKSFGWDSSDAWQQHDVQELCRVMFDALETKWKKTDQENLINNLYQGKLKDYVKCLECENESARTDAYLDVPLVIRPFGSTQAYRSVEESLNAFVKPEILDGNNQYFCEKCDKKCDAHKGLKFVTFPYLLTLQLKRFDFDYNTMHRIKLNDKMTFPETLDLNHLIDDGTRKSTKGSVDLPADVRENNSPEAMNNGVFDEVDEGIDIESSSSGTSVDSAGITADQPANLTEAMNKKNLHTSKGPFVYELFSIMIHSGSAAGGHYYAYIKSFTDGQWYCFNDQHVSKITYDDIKKTYGGSSASRTGYYSASYTSSTNAYMLMYRRIDKTQNKEFLQPSEFPPHLMKEQDSMNMNEEAERQRREIEKSLCRIKVYCMHPVQQKQIDIRLEIHKDKTLTDATEMSYKLLELQDVVPLDRVRLVKYDEFHDSLECSYEEQENTAMATLLGGIKSSYMFDLLLEIRRPDQTFQEYKPGGITVKLYGVDTIKEELRPPVTLRAYVTETVEDFKKHVAEELKLDADHVVCVFERYHNDLRQLIVPNKTLKAEGFYRSNKVFVDITNDSADEKAPFFVTRFYKILDRYQNTIRIQVNIPSIDEVEELSKSLKSLDNKVKIPTLEELDKINKVHHKPEQNGIVNTELNGEHVDNDDWDKNGDIDEGIVDSEDSVNPSSSTSCYNAESDVTKTENMSCDPPKLNNHHSAIPKTISKCENLNSSTSCTDSSHNTNRRSAVHDISPSNDEADEDLIIDRTPDGAESNGSVPNEVMTEEDKNRYFSANWTPYSVSKDRVAHVEVDKRISLTAFKTRLGDLIEIDSDNFKIFRVYSNNQEFECTRLNDTLSSFGDDSKLNVKLGRALRPGEYRVKVNQLLPNELEPIKHLLDTVFTKGMTVGQSKYIVQHELKTHMNIDVPIDRLRLRKKTWKNPGLIYSDSLVYDEDITVFANWELCFEILEGPEKVTSADHIAVYAKRWRPSEMKFDDFEEVIVPSSSVEDMIKMLSDVSGIPPEQVEFSKGRGTFPCDVSVLDAQTELDWNPNVTSLNSWPLYICEDGNVIFYRDKDEQIKELSEDEKKELQQKENTRLARTGARLTYTPRKERALKIYTEDHPNNSDLD